MCKITCPEYGCENGLVDSGGTTPWGEWINLPCGFCNGKGYIEVSDITDAERADEYRSTLQYVLDNLSQREERPDSCATDEMLIRYIKQALSKEGMAVGVEYSRQVKEVVSKINQEKNAST